MKMSKYDPLRLHLDNQARPEITLTFNEIEKILADTLPASATKYAEWWANEMNPRTTHVQCKSWLAAGFKAFPNIAASQVRFLKSR
jgi:hypothetical protein